MRGIKHSGVEKFVRTGKEGSQRKKKNQILCYIASADCECLIRTDFNQSTASKKKRRGKTQNIIHIINPNICTCRA